MEFNATFLLSAISFIVFVIIMNKIFYKPVLQIMKERQTFVENNYNEANNFQRITEERIQYREDRLENSRSSSREKIAKESQELKDARTKELASYKEEVYSSIHQQKEEMRTSAIEAKEVLKDKVVSIAKDISDILLGETIEKEKINKDQIEE